MGLYNYSCLARYRQKSQEKTIKNMAMMISTLSNTIKELTTQAQNGGEQEDELRGSIIIAGGHDGSSYLNSTEMFDFATKTWQILSSMKESRLAPSTFLYQNNVIVAGGFNGDCSTDRMEGMNTTRDPKVWRDFPARLPLKCNRHQIVAYQNRLIITGGESSDENQISDAIYEISITPPHTSKVTCRMPNPLVGHAAQLHDDSILIIGGRTSNRFKDATNTVLSYDVNKRKCRELVPLPVEVSQMAVVRHGGNLVIIGGQDKDGNVLDAVIVYNIETGRYRSLPNMKAKRAACSAVLLGNQIVVMGGRDDKKNYLSSVECLSLERQEWVKLPEMNVPRMYGSALVIPED